MRRTVTIISSALLATAMVAGPLMAAPVSAAPAAGPSPQISCGAAGPPVCDAIDQVSSLLGPLQPVLSLLGPTAGPLGTSTADLATLLAGGPSLPAQDVAAAAGAVLDQLSALSDPLLGALKGAGLDIGPLESALGQLRALAQQQITPASAGGTASPATPAAPAAPASPGGTASAASADGATGFDASVSSGGSSLPSITASRALPDVPVGSTLTLDPSDLPQLRLSSIPSSVSEPEEQAFIDEPIVPAVAAADVLPDTPDDTKATAAVIALCTIMLAAGLLIDQVRKARTPFQI